jgi:competence protein ComEC
MTERTQIDWTSDATLRDWTVAGAAALTVAAALVAPAVPVPAALGLLVVSACLRRPPLVALAIALLVGARAHDQIDALAAPLPERIRGTVLLVDDPRPQEFGLRAVISADGRRYLAEVPAEHAALLRASATGDHLVIEGRPRPLRGAPQGWVRSQHLAGRLSVTRLQRGPPAAPWFAAANAARRTLTAGAASFGDEHRPLYLGMVMGDDRELSDLRRFRFRAAGLSHLSAVSGQNVAFVLAVAAPLLQRLERRGRAVATLALLVSFVLVTRAEPSVLRAGVMAGIGVVALTTGRLAPGLRILSLTVMVLLVVDPLLVHSLGFRLSIAATAGLVLLTGPIEQRLPGPRWLRLPLAVTSAAQLATAPLLVTLDGGLSPASIPANLAAVPAAGLLMMLGVTVGPVAGLVAEPIAAVLQLPARALVAWIDQVATWGAAAPVAALGPWDLLGLLGALAVVAAARHLGALRPAAVTLGVAGVLVAVWPTGPSPGAHRPADGVAVTVGTCGGVVVHLDGDARPVPTLDGLRAVGVRRIDALVVGAASGARRTAADVEEQLPVRRRWNLEGDDAGGPPARGVSWSVGGVEVVADARSATVEPSEAACRLAP